MMKFTNPLFRFSTQGAITKKTFQKFNEKYAANVQAFKLKAESSGAAKYNVQRNHQKPYVHPANLDHKPINQGTMKWLQNTSAVIGPQQVSPHYEHFSFARRHAITFWAGLVVLRFIAGTEDIFMFAESATGAWCFLFSYMYFYTEGKKYFLMPMLGRFYTKIATMEMQNLDTYYQENVEVRVRNLMAIAKAQLEYKLVHNDYMSIRNNSLLGFLINEQVALKNHIHERAQSILKQAEAIELNNQNKIISDVMSQTLKSIDVAYENNKQKIENEFFNLALEGLAKGRMEFTNDPILPYVLETINQTVAKFEKISPEQQNNMVSLTQDQLEVLKANDVRARDEFLSNAPKIDGSLRQNEIVGKILDRWGQ